MKAAILILLFWFVALLCKAAGGFTIDIARPDYTLLVNRTHTERTVALFDYYSKFIRDRDSATIFSAIDTVRSLAKQHHDDDLALEADLMEAHYYAYRYDNRLPELTEKIQRLINKAKNKNALWLQARAESLLGTRLLENEQFEAALIHLSKTNELLKDQSAEEYPIKQIVIYISAGMHLRFREYAEAIKLGKEALGYSGKYDQHYYYMGILNLLGVSYRGLNMLDSSNAYFNYAARKAQQTNDTLWNVISLGNVGENYYRQGNFKDAKPLIENDLRFNESDKGWGNASQSLSLLGDIALQEKNLSLAHRYITRAVEYANRTDRYERKGVAYPMAVKLYAAEHKPELVRRYLDSTLMVNDSLNRAFDHIMLARANEKLELEKIALVTEHLIYTRTQQVYIRNSIIALLGFLLIVGLMLFNKHRLEVKNREIVARVETERIETELQLATARLGEFLKTIQLKNSELEQAAEELQNLRSFIIIGGPPHVLPNADETDLEQLQQTTILTEDDWQNFKLLFEKVHPGFFERLKTKLPGLSPADVRFAALTKLKLSPKEMAGILGVGADAIRQYRSRLRKKLKLQPEEEIETLVESV